MTRVSGILVMQGVCMLTKKRAIQVSKVVRWAGRIENQDMASLVCMIALISTWRR